ncbi:MAG: hypothetical protein ACXV8I_08010 [Methylobacter sp.]
MIEAFRELGFSNADFLILWACPLLAVIGAIVHTFTTDLDYSKTPKLKDYDPAIMDINKDLEKMVIEHRGLWIMSRLFIGASSGLVLGLYFAGSIKPEATSIGRLLALSIISGYVAPSFWNSQGKLGVLSVTKEIERLNK